MTLDERQLAVVLQACLEHAKELLEQHGGFPPFGARGLPSGAIEFFENLAGPEDEPVAALYRRIGEMFADDARSGTILAAALVGHVGLPEGSTPSFTQGVSVQVEAQGFCRAVVAPYRLAGDAVEFGPLVPGEARPAVFAPAS